LIWPEGYFNPYTCPLQFPSKGSDSIATKHLKGSIYDDGAKMLLDVLLESGIQCHLSHNAFFEKNGTNAAWHLAERYDGRQGVLLFIPTLNKEDKNAH
jgi:hypothetical protein